MTRERNGEESSEEIADQARYAFVERRHRNEPSV